MTLICGIDESGKGPVIGSLFIVGTLFDEKDLPILKKLGVKDSKLLPHKKRIKLAEEIYKIAKKIKIIQITPEEVDYAVLRNDGLNLNWLEAHKTADIINALNPDKAIIDCPSTNIKKYKAYLLNLLVNKKVELIVDHKADKNFLECGSSSIIAKVMREEEIEKIKKKIGIDFGSGYTSDERTQKFLKENIDKYPEIFRKSWSTYKDNIGSKSQKGLGDF